MTYGIRNSRQIAAMHRISTLNFLQMMQAFKYMTVILLVVRCQETRLLMSSRYRFTTLAGRDLT